MSDVFLKINGAVTLHKLGDREGMTKCNASITEARKVLHSSGDFRICPYCCRYIPQNKIDNTVAYLSQKRRGVQTINKFRKEPDFMTVLKNDVVKK